MNDWPDAKIRSTALWYIGKHCMEPATWRQTRVGEAQPEALSLFILQTSESPLIGFFLSPESWYVFTTRRVVGAYAGRFVDVAALDVLGNRFGEFKGHRGEELNAMTLRFADGGEADLQYETGLAAMAPIYYLRYWTAKYPILHKLKDDLKA